MAKFNGHHGLQEVYELGRMRTVTEEEVHALQAAAPVTIKNRKLALSHKELSSDAACTAACDPGVSDCQMITNAAATVVCTG